MAYATRYAYRNRGEMKHIRKTKEFKRLKTNIRFGLLGFVFLLCIGYNAFFTADQHGRRLSSAACKNIEGQRPEDGGHAVAWIFIILYAFLGLAMVCDDWFVPSLEKISETLNLSPDVAGATFLAAGSSAPELFTSLADTFDFAGTGSGNSGMGIGTIVGSAMFNILIIVAMAAAATTEVLSIDWRPVVRDCAFYSLSILELILFFSTGEKESAIEWWEGLIMTLTYGLYILFMVYNEKIFDQCKKTDQVKPLVEDDAEYKPGRRTSEHPHKGLFQGADRKVVLSDGTETEMEDGKIINSGDVKTDGDLPPPPPKTPPPNATEEKEEEEPYFHRFSFPSDDPPLDKFLWVISFPLLCIFTMLVPDCGHPKGEKFYIVTFIMSILVIGALCHVMVQFAGYVGCIFGIDAFIMGTMVLAVGTSVPDALGSMIVARAGEADMAIANAVGSNVFDILLGLGFPWFLYGVINETSIQVCNQGILAPVLILFSTVLLFFLVLIVNKWKMSNKLGIAFVSLYALYMIYNVLKATKVLPDGSCAPDSSVGSSALQENSTRLL